MPTPLLRAFFTTLSCLPVTLLLASCGGGSSTGDAPSTPVQPAAPTTIAAAQDCLQGSPYTVTLVGSEQVPSDTVYQLVCIFAEAYPKTIALLSNPNPVKNVKFVFKPDAGYEAFAGGDTITFDARVLSINPLGVDVVVHEGAHIVQANRGQVPSWIVEGSADYVRGLYGLRNIERDWSIGTAFDGRHYTYGYTAAAAFLKWVDAVYRQGQPRVMEAIYQSANIQPYNDSLWVDMTGKTLDTLWNEYVNQPIATAFTSGVSLYFAPLYQGRFVQLERGRYDLAALLSHSVPDNEIASIKVPAGYKVKAYADVGFAGEMVELTADTSALPAGMTRRISSLVVE